MQFYGQFSSNLAVVLVPQLLVVIAKCCQSVFTAALNANRSSNLDIDCLRCIGETLISFGTILVKSKYKLWYLKLSVT